MITYKVIYSTQFRSNILYSFKTRSAAEKRAAKLRTELNFGNNGFNEYLTVIPVKR